LNSIEGQIFLIIFGKSFAARVFQNNQPKNSQTMKQTRIPSIVILMSLFFWTSCGDNATTETETSEVEAFSAIRTDLPSLQEIIEKESEINIFLTAMDSAKMSWILRGDEDAYIIFAPTDAAFRREFDDAGLQNLLSPENRDELFKLVRKHIVKGRVPYELMEGGMQAETENRDKLIFLKNEEGEVTVNGAKIVKANIEGSNGYVHIIERVIF
jgi:uncharacterized surface protein with fasciclin (FAS1) repeats